MILSCLPLSDSSDRRVTGDHNSNQGTFEGEVNPEDTTPDQERPSVLDWSFLPCLGVDFLGRVGLNLESTHWTIAYSKSAELLPTV
jgi:hypothetical protein